MKELIEIPENVRSFQDKCSLIVGRHAEEQYSIEIFNRVQDYKIESPIEQLFLAAFEALRIINGFPECADTFLDGKEISIGTSVFCQENLDKYRPDFIIFHRSIQMARDNKPPIGIVVECDGHSFHDSNEIQRRYEKKRDRHIQKMGYKVFRYTGSEIVKDPFVPAAECLGYATGEKPEDLINWLKEFTRE